MRVIGISGEAGSGKDTVALLFERLSDGTQVISLSHLIRNDIERMEISPDRQIQTLVGNYRRATGGVGYWIESALRESDNDSKYLVLVGIYASGEANYIHKIGGTILWIDASEDNRMERIKNRLDGPRDQLISTDIEAFRLQLASESGKNSVLETQASLAKAKKQRDYVIKNDGSYDDLEKSVRSFLKSIEEAQATEKGNLPLISTDDDVVKYDVNSPWTDEIEKLASLEKTDFFEKFLGSSESLVSADIDDIKIGMSLNDMVRFLHKPNLRSITGNQTAKRMARIFEKENPSIALKNLRLLKPSNQEEEYFTGLTDSEFYDLHLHAQIKWIQRAPEVRRSLPKRMEQICDIDRLQFEPQKDRSLDRMNRDGVILSVINEYVPQVRELTHNPVCNFGPILEIVKNDRIFKVSDFVGSKASLVVHDIIDHLWTFDLLSRIGLFEKYHEMFDAIGNPHKTDIFKREGEVVASISYGVRAFEGVAPGFRPIMYTKDIIQKVRKMRGRLSSRHTDALRIVNNLESDGTEWRSLGYTFSNYITELDEQRRTYGSIKFKDPKTQRISGELDPFSPDYLCFFIETHHALLDSNNKHRNALFYTHYLIEEYLRNVSIQDADMKPVAITPDLLNRQELNHTSAVPRDVAVWMFRNYGFTANRNEV